MEVYGNVAISIDIMKVNIVSFLVTISTVLHYAAIFELIDMIRLNPLLSQSKVIINKNWGLVDSQSTMDIFQVETCL